MTETHQIPYSFISCHFTHQLVRTAGRERILRLPAPPAPSPAPGSSTQPPPQRAFLRC